LQQHDPDKLRGLLYLLDPRWADLIEDEHKFGLAIERAWETGRLYVQEEPTIQ
jgi:hypothetical protein